MTTYSWSQYAATAKEAGAGPSLPVGEGYTGEIIDAGANTTGAKPRLFWKFQIIGGPHHGKTERMVQVLTTDKPEALAAFYSVLSVLGIHMENVQDGTPPAAVAKLAVGRRFTFDLAHREHNGRTYAQFNNLKPVETVQVVQQAPVAPAPVAQVPVPGPSVEELQAQLAALQAQAPAAVPVPATGGKLPF